MLRIFQVTGLNLVSKVEPGIVLQQLARFQIENPIFQIHQFFTPVELIAAAPEVFPPSQALGNFAEIVRQKTPGRDFREEVCKPCRQLGNGLVAAQLFVIGERLPVLGKQENFGFCDLLHQIGEEIRPLPRAFGCGSRRFRLLFLRKPLALPSGGFLRHLAHTSTEILRIVILVLPIREQKFRTHLDSSR